MVERGVILGGGNGTRLDMKNGFNKHAVEVAGRPMIGYPLLAMKEMGLSRVTIVANPWNVGDLAKFIKDGKDYGLEVEYRIQNEVNGMAGALGASAVKESVFVVMCGDCYFDPAPKLDGFPQLWWAEHPENHNNGAVWVPETNRIVEKPTKDLGNRAIIGARVYDQNAMRLIGDLKPSARGELELVDIDNWYLANDLEMTHYSGFFGDMGTLAGLARVERHIHDNRLSS